MKKIVSYIGGVALLAAMTIGFTACAPEEFAGPNKDGIPLASDYDDAVKVTVNQETNTAYFTFEAREGVTPVWIIDGKQYTSAFETSKYYRKAGDYTVDIKIANANGMSDGTLTRSFNIEKTKMDGFQGFVYESDFNLWTKATIENPTFWYAPGWGQIDDPAYTFINGAYTVVLPAKTFETWQAQMALKTNLTTSSEKTYDFSVILTSSVDHPGVMLKLVDKADDKIFYFAETIALVANEPVCFWKSDMEGIDADLDMVLDFGGNAENTTVIIENFVLKDHADDDGTIIPIIDETPEPAWVAVDSDDNLWKGANFTNGFFYANADWTPRSNPSLAIDGTVYTLELPEATAERWQAQATFITDGLALSAAEEYDFRVTLKASNAIDGVTVKLGQQLEGTDDPALFGVQIDLAADADYVFKAKKKAGVDMQRAKLIFDFGTNPANTTVVIKDVILQVHKD